MVRKINIKWWKIKKKNIEIRTPYDHTTLGHQLFHSLVQMSFVSSYFVSYTCNVTIFLGLIFYLQAFRKDFEFTFDKIDKLFDDQRLSDEEIDSKSKSLLYDSFKMQEMLMKYRNL